MMFAVGGMMLFPAANDLLTMFVALEVLSLPLYLLCGLARRRRLLSQEAAMKYFLLGAFSSGFFLYGIALIYGYAGSMDFGADQRGRASTAPATRPCCSSGWGCWRSACCSRSARRRSTPGRPTSTRARRPRSRRSWRRHQGGRVRCPAAPVLRRLRQRPLDLAADDVGDRDPHHGRRLRAGARPDRHEADAGLLLDRAHRLPAHRRPRAAGRSTRSTTARSPRSRPCCSTWSPTASPPSAPSRSSAWCATAPASSRPSPAGPASGKQSPVVAGVFALFLLSMAGIPLTAGFIGKWAVFEVALVGRCLAGGHRRRPGQRGGRVLLRPGDRGDVLPGARLARARTSPTRRLLTATVIGISASATLVLGPGARAGARPGAGCGRIHQVTDTSARDGLSSLAMPVPDEALARRLTDRMDEVEAGPGRARAQRGAVRHRGGAAT